MNFRLAFIDQGLESHIELLEKSPPQCLEKHLGICFRKVSREEVCAELEATAELKQPFGLLHGGVLAAFAESISSLGAWCSVDPKTQSVVGVSLYINHLRSVSSGIIHGCAKPLHQGRTTQVWSAKIKDENSELVASAQVTLLVKSSETI